MKKLHLLFAILFTSLCLISCDSDDKPRIYDLSFNSYEYVLTMSESDVNISIKSGNSNYGIQSEDESIATASIELPGPGYGTSLFGCIKINTKSKGRTTFTVTDKVTLQEVKLRITVIDPYLVLKCGGQEEVINLKDKNWENAYQISKGMKENSWFTPDEKFVLVKDSPRTLYILSSKDEIIHKGEYEFVLQEKEPYIFFRYPENSEWQEFSFPILSGGYGLGAINHFFGLNWDLSRGQDSRMASTPPIFLTLAEYFTEEYSTNYPELELALLKSHLTIKTSSENSLSDKIIKEMLGE
ncbi:MAG: hypothetical protein LUH22_10785 [Bacteroides sp.]|nr:hypothetical protein [Bacteroides sp.]